MTKPIGETMTTKSKAVKEALVVAETLEGISFLDRASIVRNVADEADLYRFCYNTSVQQFCAIAQALGLPEDGTVTPETILCEIQRLKRPTSANTFEALQERAIALEQMVREKDDTIESVRKALRYGADDALWPPGQSMGDVVERLVETRTYFEWQFKQTGQCLEYRLSRNDLTRISLCAGIYTVTYSDESTGVLWYLIPNAADYTSDFCDTVEEAYAAVVACIGTHFGPVAAKIIPPLP